MSTLKLTLADVAVVQRAAAMRESQAKQVDRDNPDDPWAALSFWEEYDHLNELAKRLEAYRNAQETT